MSTISTVAVDFVANVAKYTEGLIKMKKQTAQFSAGLEKDIASASSTLLKLGTAASAAGIALYTGLAYGIGKSIEEISRLKDEADKVGSTAEGFMLLTSAAQKSGAGAENMRKAMSELTKSLGEAFQAGSKTSDEFTRLGIDIIKLNGLSADKQFIAVAEALNRIPDRTERARIGTALLGKEYTQLAIVIKEINNIDVPIGKNLSQQDIENIKAVGESFDNLKESISGVFNILAAGFGPQLKQIFDSLSKGIKDFLSDGSAMLNIFSAMATPILMVAGAIDFFRANIKRGELYILALGGVVADVFRNITLSITKGIETIINFSNKSIEAINKFAGKQLITPFSKDYINQLRQDAKTTVDVFKETVAKTKEEIAAIEPGGKESFFTKTLDFFSTGISSAIGAATKAAKSGVIDAKKEFESVVLEPATQKYKSEIPMGLADISNRIKQFNAENPQPLGNFALSLLKSTNEVNSATDVMVTKQDLRVHKFIYNLEKMGAELSDALKKVVDDADKKLTSLGEAMTMSVETPLQTYERELSNINLLLEKNKISQETASRATQQAFEKLLTYNPYFKELANFGQKFADGLANAIVEGQNFSDALKNVFNSILKDVATLILRMTILQGIMAAIGFVNPAAGIAFGKMVGILTGPATPKATGGPVNMGQAYRVGEAGPETFVPQTNGYIVPNDMAPSETVIVNQTINVQTGVAQTVRAEMYGLLPRFKQEALAGVLDAKQRGGSYSKGLAA